MTALTPVTRHHQREDPTMTGAKIAQLHATRIDVTTIERAPVSNPDSDVLIDIVADRPAMVVMSPTVDRIYGSTIRPAAALAGVGQVIVAPTGEANKTLATVADIVSVAGDSGLSRDGVIIGIGGGILLDMVGLAAMLFRRGVTHIKIGTTLVAQVDAAVGLKCGVNLGAAKNTIGGFYPPERVLTDAAFLATVATHEIRCGLAEMIKLGIVVDAELFDQIAANGTTLINSADVESTDSCWLVDRSIASMITELNANPFEGELQRRVDFGHTISPRLEAETGYQLRHGEAVAIDMAFFSVLSNELGMLANDDLAAIFDVFAKFGIKVWHDLLGDQDLISEALSAAEAHRGRSLNLPMPTGIGTSQFVETCAEVSPAALRTATSRLRKVAS